MVTVSFLRLNTIHYSATLTQPSNQDLSTSPSEYFSLFSLKKKTLLQKHLLLAVCLHSIQRKHPPFVSPGKKSPLCREFGVSGCVLYDSKGTLNLREAFPSQIKKRKRKSQGWIRSREMVSYAENLWVKDHWYWTLKGATLHELLSHLSV